MGEETKMGKAEAAAEKAHYKALRPWYQKKRFIIPLVFAVFLLIVSIADSASDKEDSVLSSERRLFPDRADAQKGDRERNIGGSVKLSGYTVTVTSADFQPSISMFEEKGYIRVSVIVENRDEEAQSYNEFVWKLQTPGGQVINPSLTTNDNNLGAGDLLHGGKVDGAIVFEVGEEKGDFYIIYKPDLFDASRGIWKVTA